MGGSASTRARALCSDANRLLTPCNDGRYWFKYFLMPQRFSPDHERFKAQLAHFIYSYGWSASGLSVLLTNDPTRAHDYPKGKRLPTRATRQEWRAFMRDYRQSVMI
jgi:hypothetical protein